MSYDLLFNMLFGKPIQPWKFRDKVDEVTIDEAIRRFLESDVGGRLSPVQTLVVEKLYGLDGSEGIDILALSQTNGIPIPVLNRALELAKNRLKRPTRLTQLEKYIVED